MNPVDLLLRAEAVQLGRAKPRRRLRHVHVEPAPLGIAALQMAGEPHSIWAGLVGTDPQKPKFILAPEPRNYDIEFAALAELGACVCDAVMRSANGPHEFVQRRTGAPKKRFSTAPQLLVPSAAGAQHLRRLGRRMRPAGFGGKKTVPPVVNAAGAHLGFYAEAAEHPGSSLMLVATRELGRHFVTGQSDLEDAHLGTQLAWHDPVLLAEIDPNLGATGALRRLDGATAAGLVERLPMGVLTAPEEDSASLVDLVVAFNRRRQRSTDPAVVSRIATELGFEAALRPILLPIWRAMWIAHRILLNLAPAPSVASRWAQDRTLLTNHVEYVEKGGRIASVSSIRRAAVQLGMREEALASLTCTETLEDPLAMAAALAAGQAIRGKVVDVDLAHKERPKKRMVSRPLITLAMDVDCPFPVGAELYWTTRTEVAAEVASVAPTKDATRVVLKVKSGMSGDLPTKGSTAIFSVFNDAWFPPAPLPPHNPWTHEPDPDAPTNDSLEMDDGPPLDQMIGTEPPPPVEAT